VLVLMFGFLGRSPLAGLALLTLTALPAGAVDREKGARDLIPGAPAFFDIRPITLPVIEGNRVTRQVGILLTVELAKGHAKQEASQKVDELTDGFITELYRIYGWRAGANRVVNEQLVKDRLLASAQRVLGHGAVRAVLIRQLVEQDR